MYRCRFGATAVTISPSPIEATGSILQIADYFAQIAR
jgi:hypothetical protein